MRILFLTFQFPYPPDNGARIKTLSILEYLRPRHEMSIACLTRGAPDDEQQRWSKTFGDVRWVKLDRGRNAVNLTRSYLTGLPLSVERNRCPQMSRLVTEKFAEAGFEALFVDGWVMAQYVPESFRGRKLLHEHNAEYLIWERQAGLGCGLRGTLARREAQRVRAYEATILPQFDTVLAVSEQDRKALLAIGADSAKTLVLPNLPDASLLELPSLSYAESEPVVFYFGTLSWQPNIDGLTRLLARVFPLLRARTPDARMLIAGRDAPPALERLALETPGVDFLGAVPDPESLYRRARVFVEATQSGGGTKLKILNSLARGLPVVASPEAAAGIEATPGEHLLIDGEDETMAADVARLLSDSALWQRLSENGRGLIQDKYVADRAFAVLNAALAGGQSRA